MKIINGVSHTHGLNAPILAFIEATFGNREAFFLETVEVPAEIAEGLDYLHGPTKGDTEIPESECFYAQRNGRAGNTRFTTREPRKTNKLTVIGGPEKGYDGCILYTAFWGERAMREPFDPDIAGNAEQIAASTAFWATHALSLTM